ncbi:MAG TPA: hypothetical protein VLD59_15505, partial [Steroidobacteraceae bacterium]|nr:hypothetical protein [Steroidobacteraceae bacterium]
MRKAILGFGTVAPGAKKSPRVQPLKWIFTQHRSVLVELQNPEAQTVGHDRPKSPVTIPKWS